MGKGEYTKAVTVFLAIMESLTHRFVEDEHYNYFDDMYSPDYVCQDMMETIIDSIKGGTFPDKEMQRLKDGLEKLKHSDGMVFHIMVELVSCQIESLHRFGNGVVFGLFGSYETFSNIHMLLGVVHHDADLLLGNGIL